MASGRATVNDIFASFLAVRDIGEGQVAPIRSAVAARLITCRVPRRRTLPPVMR
jgi:hypothetical protein